ncbi:hypothetical protein PPROV_001111100 [Pycnococcus provasolii]|uniref:TIR domain-containing protein n=1 Tax=Pycnococcus provasolii TaxID=41880 RepID=A0A830I009_9CHLO|nr:hypothetical protein PPROV_001111100 [Pycnococcus provasolii]
MMGPPVLEPALEQEYLARRESIAKFDFDSFKIEEVERREQLGAGRANDIFFSHCWRGKDEKITKRKWAINERLTRPEAKDGPNYRAWCDYLDLQAKGPVAWRKEIEDGIRDAGKMVCLVDMPYLHSFNCLQEVAMAQRMGKPIIFVMLEKTALDIISSADHGARQLWSDKPPTETGDLAKPLSAFANANWGSADGTDPFNNDDEQSSID